MWGRQDQDKVGQMLKAAANEKKNGNMDRAITILREVNRTADRRVWPIRDFLRLPLYLQGAGRSDEAWAEFNSLIVRVKRESANSVKMAIDIWQIYDKMRLLLQREQLHLQAVRFGVLSYMWRLVSLRRERSLYRDLASKEETRKTVMTLTRRTKIIDLTEGILHIVESHKRTIPEINLDKLNAELNSLLAQHSDPRSIP